MVDPEFCHRLLVWMSKPYVSVVLFYSGLYRSVSLSNVHVTTLTGYAVNLRSAQPQFVLHWTKETGDLPRLQSNTIPYRALALCKKVERTDLHFGKVVM